MPRYAKLKQNQQPPNALPIILVMGILHTVSCTKLGDIATGIRDGSNLIENANLSTASSTFKCPQNSCEPNGYFGQPISSENPPQNCSATATDSNSAVTICYKPTAYQGMSPSELNRQIAYVASNNFDPKNLDSYEHIVPLNEDGSSAGNPTPNTGMIRPTQNGFLYFKVRSNTAGNAIINIFPKPNEVYQDTNALNTRGRLVKLNFTNNTSAGSTAGPTKTCWSIETSNLLGYALAPVLPNADAAPSNSKSARVKLSLNLATLQSELSNKPKGTKSSLEMELREENKSLEIPSNFFEIPLPQAANAREISIIKTSENPKKIDTLVMHISEQKNLGVFDFYVNPTTLASKKFYLIIYAYFTNTERGINTPVHLLNYTFTKTKSGEACDDKTEFALD